VHAAPAVSCAIGAQRDAQLGTSNGRQDHTVLPLSLIIFEQRPSPLLGYGDTYAGPDLITIPEIEVSGHHPFGKGFHVLGGD